MKKTLYFRLIISLTLLIVTVLASTNSSSAQNNNPGPKFGIKGGLNLSQLYVEQPDVEDENMKAGIHFGVFGKIPINSFVAVQPEVLYTNMGSKVSYGGSDFENRFGIETGEIRFNLNYIQVPIALAVNVGPLNIHAGPYLSYLLSANVKNWNSSELSPNVVQQLDTKDFNRVDYGLVVGVGFDIKNVNVGARYNYGLREVGNTNLAGNLTNNSKNGVGQIYLGFGF
ncbi:porin family protein [Cyclobacterium xiamenense]|uniref:porin family protein n=1 Tax=Cyclobacterium xiamenense TaxID=1297121 RepID=UPI0012B72A0B|nr:porin family protein [Cyclobacterium xiamenense]